MGCIKINKNYFQISNPWIINNSNLREPQIEAYGKIVEYYRGDYKNRNSLVVLPTGVGKTGVMAIAPFMVSNKRTLIITPGTTIRDTVLDELDPTNAQNFWNRCEIFKSPNMLPTVIEYIGNNTPLAVLEQANIVILNIHKLQERLNSSLLKVVDKDFFDFIIIDEAHHSTAKTWVDTVKYFSNAKVLKVTGTPFRTDGEKIVGNLIYKYSLCRAMAREYIKSLSNIVYIPQELKLTIDNTNKEYSVQEIFDMGLREQEWISRSVAFSEECSEKVVVESIKILKGKLVGSNVPHKIIAIACSIEHANQIRKLYEKYNMRVTVIHSKLESNEKSKAFSDVENNRVDVVINIAMLGEGYDHPYLSVAAIFRPFRNELPYTQFIGRVLRKIHDGNDSDNIAHVISHNNLYLDELWEKYKKEIEQKDIIRSLIEDEEIYEIESGEEFSDINHRDINNVIQLGVVKESKEYSVREESYLDTELIKRSEKEKEELQKTIEKLMKAIPGITEEQAELIYQQNSNNNNILVKRPDLLFRAKRADIDKEIRERMVPQIISKYNLDDTKTDFERCGLFEGKYWSIRNYVKKDKKNRNAALLAIFYNSYLKNKIGISREEWSPDDYDRAFIILDDLNKYVEKRLNDYYN